MKAVIFCEGTTDLMMIQFVLQYRYGWIYDGFLENAVTNRLLKKVLKHEGSIIEIRSCGGMMNIPNKLREFQDQMEFASREEEFFDKIIVLIDHDTMDSNKTFIDKINAKLDIDLCEEDINHDKSWKISNFAKEDYKVELHIHCIPEVQTGAIENIMLEALATDSVEENIIDRSRKFILETARNQNRYLQKKSYVSKAVFNTYFAIRTPEEKYDERAKILKAYNWKDNEILNAGFSFLDILAEA